ncbi:MAG TPA: methylmalonyl-CoA mutase family protein [Actinomycetota bacterium]|jgi:methylmalonyl-CoA mutase N-terminal domain/subunit|nr:methylmalonyl-CoA mutase family protein [Actinomycetota bacterium]
MSERGTRGGNSPGADEPGLRKASAPLDKKRESWRHKYRRAGERDADFETISGEPLEPLYTPEDVADLDYDGDLGYPGEYPYTRGVYHSMYRGRLWTMRQFAGYGTPEETNRRYKFLLEHGQGGLSVAFDMPTLMGRDSDDPRSEGEVGRCGVATDSLADFEVLFGGIPLGEITTSMTISGPAPVIFAFFLAAAERQGVDWKVLDGTLQTDILKEYIAQKEWIFPPRPHLRLIGDLMEFCAQEVPKWHPISVSGYHIREAGSTAVQELAFTLADGFSYVELGKDRGLDVDAFAPALSFFFNAHIDFFEEIAKYRAARRIWARWLRERYGAIDPMSWRLRFHTQTAGCSLTAQQPENNIIRTAIEALAAVLGGTQSLHTNALDEVLALPTEKAAQIALRTQQIIAHETGVPDVIDPLGGSYFVETLTNRVEQQAEEYFRRIEEMGKGSILDGVLTGIEGGFFQSEIADAAYREQKRYEKGRLVRVGVNEFVDPDEGPIEILKIGPEVEARQVDQVKSLRGGRNQEDAGRALERLKAAARTDDENLMPPMIECARAYCTEGEIVGALRGVFGEYVETPRF